MASLNVGLALKLVLSQCASLALSDTFAFIHLTVTSVHDIIIISGVTDHQMFGVEFLGAYELELHPRV